MKSVLESNGNFSSSKVQTDVVTCAGQLLGVGQITLCDVTWSTVEIVLVAFLHVLIKNNIIILADSTKHKIVIFASCFWFSYNNGMMKRGTEFYYFFKRRSYPCFVIRNEVLSRGSFVILIFNPLNGLNFHFALMQALLFLCSISLSSFVDSRFSSALHFIVKTFSYMSSFTFTFRNCHCKA